MNAAKQAIEEVCARLNRPVCVDGMMKAPQVLRFAITPLHRTTGRGNSGQLTQIGHLRRLTDDIALGLGVESVNIAFDNGRLWLEVPNPNRPTITWLDFVRKLDLRNMKLPVPLGYSVMGKPLVLDLADPATPHMLIAGTTQSGKTNLLACILATYVAFRRDIEIWLIDTKGQLAHFRGPCLVCNDANEALSRLQVVYNEANARFKGLRPAKPWLIVIDEYADLALQVKEVETVMAQIAQKVAAANIHLILATQRPSVDVVTGLIKANFPARVALSVVTHIDSQVIIDQPGAEKLLGRGDGLLMLHKGLTRFQAPYINILK